MLNLTKFADWNTNHSIYQPGHEKNSGGTHFWKHYSFQTLSTEQCLCTVSHRQTHTQILSHTHNQTVAMCNEDPSSLQIHSPIKHSLEDWWTICLLHARTLGTAWMDGDISPLESEGWAGKRPSSVVVVFSWHDELLVSLIYTEGVRKTYDWSNPQDCLLISCFMDSINILNGIRLQTIEQTCTDNRAKGSHEY